jgi:alpha-methylacyl-CoA racemase
MNSEHTQPLKDIKVVSLALNVPGPAAAIRLSRLGASVTKIEPPGGEPFAQWCPPWYETLCAGQRVLCLDLKSVRGLDEMKGLLEETDLFLTSIRPSALDQLSLGWTGIHSRHPRLCQVAIVGYPSPNQNKVGHDLNYQAAFGLLSPPHIPRTLLADLAGAERAVSSAMALLYARERGFGAGYAEVTLSESADIFAEPLRYGITAPGGLLGGGLPQYNLYETRQGWIAVAALEEHFQHRLAKELGFDRSNISHEEFQEIFVTKTAVEWEVWATALDLPIAAVR